MVFQKKQIPLWERWKGLFYFLVILLVIAIIYYFLVSRNSMQSIQFERIENAILDTSRLDLRLERVSDNTLLVTEVLFINKTNLTKIARFRSNFLPMDRKVQFKYDLEASKIGNSVVEPILSTAVKGSTVFYLDNNGVVMSEKAVWQYKTKTSGDELIHCIKQGGHMREFETVNIELIGLKLKNINLYRNKNLVPINESEIKDSLVLLKEVLANDDVCLFF